MKNKYQRMSSEEKKKCKNEYFKTTKGKDMKSRFLRLYICGTLGILFSVFLVVSGYIANEINWATWAMAIILLIFSIVFIVGALILKGQVLNNYAVKNMKENAKKEK